MPRRKSICYALAAAVVAGLLLVASVEALIPWAWQNCVDRQIREMLTAREPELRKQGAWQICLRSTGRGSDFLIDALARGSESNPDVREAYVYALGRLHMSDCFDLLLRTAREDPSGYVRQAAWVAAARADLPRFRAVVAARGDLPHLPAAP